MCEAAEIERKKTRGVLTVNGKQLQKSVYVVKPRGSEGNIKKKGDSEIGHLHRRKWTWSLSQRMK